MFDMTKLKFGKYEVKLPDGEIIELKPPKIKVIKKITRLAAIKREEIEEKGDEALTDLTEAIALALSANKKGKKFTADYVEDEFSVMHMYSFLKDYFEWVNKVDQEKN